MIDASKEDAYLREGASWRRMLFQQPPTTHVAVTETMTSLMNTPFSQTILKPRDDGPFLRLEHMYSGVKGGHFAAGRDPLVFWNKRFGQFEVRD